ncbi:MAG: thiamine phosphate synthase [Candidatus Methanoplasma sp.]|jgi:thiamine-phosphate pyrophosphorylase|nr:thiamine phosphate synthase [Candidatus Methanoplasma sp.]
MIIAVTDRRISALRDFLDQIEAIATASPDMIILREKDLSEAGYRYLAVECQRICDYHNVKFCVNSFLNVAASINNGRVQLPFDPFIANVGKLNNFEEVWVSVHSKYESMEAEKNGATHLIYGNVFETTCKPDAIGKGINELKEVCGSVRIPVFAIGGIDTGNVGMVIDAGCKGICVRNLLMRSTDPHTTMDELRKRIKKR